jgi:murein DD-endopeptidase MepM/ murein hydrolase activator NlpD
MRTALLIVALLGLLLVTVAEPLAPAVELDVPGAILGRGKTISVHASDRGRGLATLELRIVPATGTPVVLETRHFPRRSWLGSGVAEAELSATLERAEIDEGPAVLEAWARDHSWLAFVFGGTTVSRQVTLDLTPPKLEALSDRQTTQVGGTATVVYRTDPETRRDGVEVGTTFFPGTAGYFADPALRVALYTVSPTDPEGVPRLLALDAAGNERTLSLDVDVRERPFRERTLDLSDRFLERKIPPLLEEAGMRHDGDLVQGYLLVNRDLRERTEGRLLEICRESAPRQLWDGAFLSLPNGAPLSLFGDRRAYRYAGQIVDHQTHLGYDLASLRGSPVPAANTGRVVYAGPLGIYGQTVVLDHGLGLFTVYGHLRAIDVTVGALVSRGDEIGKTGETGLAGGDHLHFSTAIHGVHVDPVQWWDGRWIRDHVLARLEGHATAPAS